MLTFSISIANQFDVKTVNIWKEYEKLFFILHSNTNRIEYNPASCKRCAQILLILQAFVAQLDPHKNFLFKVSTDETECLSTIKRSN